MLTWPTLLTYVLAQTHTTTANAIFLQYTSPLWVFILAPLLLKENPQKADLAAVPPLIAGMTLIFISRLPGTALVLPHPGFGNAMGLLSGVGYAGIVLALRKWRDGSGILGLAWGNVILALIALSAGTFTDRDLVMPNLKTLSQIAYLGIVQIGLAYFLFQWSLRGITASEASILTLLEPVLCPLWAWLVVEDLPGKLSIWGGVTILVTLVLHTIWTVRARKGIPGTPRSENPASEETQE